jgi:Tol biopolymer transport system component
MKTQIALFILLLSVGAPQVWADSFITRMSLSSGSPLEPMGIEANSHSFATTAAITTDERFVVFSSEATNLVAGDRNDASDIFMRDRWMGQTIRISVDNNGVEGNAASAQPVISANGQFIAFSSKATNFVAGETNTVADIFIYDTQTKQLRGMNPLDSNGDSLNPSISADGRWVVFESTASNLVANDTNKASDIFLFDSKTNQLTRISVNDGGAQGNGNSIHPMIAANGGVVVFESEATNLVSGDTNNSSDIFLYDLTTRTTQRISQATSQADKGSYYPAVAAEGKIIAFESEATNLVTGDTNGFSDIFIHDLTTGQLQRISNANGEPINAASYYPSISATGRFIAFTTAATNLIGGNPNALFDIVKYDRITQQFERLNVNAEGAQADFQSFKQPISLSWNGTYAVFTSNATNAVYGDDNLSLDVFVHQRVTPTHAKFNFTTSLLTLPLVRLSDGRVFNATMHMNSEGYFVLDSAEQLHLDTSETSGYFSLLNGMLYLSRVDAVQPSYSNPAEEDVNFYEAVLWYVPNTDPLQFKLLRAEFLNL